MVSLYCHGHQYTLHKYIDVYQVAPLAEESPFPEWDNSANEMEANQALFHYDISPPPTHHPPPIASKQKAW